MCKIRFLGCINDHFFCFNCFFSCKSDLFPEEDIWLWISGMPLLSVRRMLAVGTILGPQKERHANWYLESGHLEKLLCQLAPHIDKIGQIIQHYAISVSNFCDHGGLHCFFLL